MGAIQVFNAARMAAIEAKAIISGMVVGDNLILTAKDGSAVNAGNVRGNPGTMTQAELDTSVRAMFSGTDADIARSPRRAGLAGAMTSKAARADHVHPAPIWNAYAPTWINTGGTNPVIGNGSLTGRFVEIGNTIIGGVTLVVGTTTTFGTVGGRFDFTLPYPTNDGSTYMPLGQVVAYNGARFWRAELLNYGSASRCYPWRDMVTTESSFTPASPFAWASGHQMRMTFCYERSSAP